MKKLLTRKLTSVSPLIAMKYRVPSGYAICAIDCVVLSHPPPTPSPAGIDLISYQEQTGTFRTVVLFSN